MTAPDRYSRTQIVLHWLVAALILFQIYFHEDIERLWRSRLNGQIDFTTPTPHVIIGTLVGLLILWRLVLRFTRGTPPPPRDEPRPLQWLAAVMHWGFYAIILVIVASGLGAWIGAIREPLQVHRLLADVLLFLVVLHALAALAHHFVLKSNVFKRMLGMA